MTRLLFFFLSVSKMEAQIKNLKIRAFKWKENAPWKQKRSD